MDQRAVFGITALRYSGNQIVEAMMGLVDSNMDKWDTSPSPTRLVDVVDRLVEGDEIIVLYPDGEGGLQRGPQVKVDVLSEGTETLVADDPQGVGLDRLPRF